jgi:endoglucanase
MQRINSQCNTALVTPPLNQPIQKSYRDWNSNWPQDSWQVTEVAIYTEASYIKLLSWFIGGSCNAFKEEPAASIVYEGNLLLYPNPADHLLTIDNDNAIEGGYLIRIVSLDGKVLKEIKNASLPVETDISSMTAGTYFVFLQTSDQLLTGKFVKQ